MRRKKMGKKIKYECVCGVVLDPEVDFIVCSRKHNVTLCRDCYDLPQWYELINK